MPERAPRKPAGKGVRRLLLAGIGLLALAVRAPAETPQPRAMVLTSKVNGTEPETVFPCAGTIYAQLTFPATETGKHALEGIWVGPDGKVLRHSRDPVEFPSQGGRTALLWFQFSDGGSMWDPLSLRGAGEGARRAYEGRWQVRALWDGRTFTQSEFTVHCF